MARVTITGIEPRDLGGYRQLLEDRFREALGSTLDLSPETPQGQLVGLLALSFAEADEALVNVSNGMSVDRAIGRQLDDIGSLVGVTRIGDELSQVTATVSGTAGETIPIGMRARTTGGEEFETLSEFVIPGNGEVDIPMFSRRAGAVEAASGALSEFVTRFSFLTSITNVSPATPGRLAETDTQFRERYGRTVARHALTSVDAITASLLEVTGVTAVRVEENDTQETVTRQGLELRPNSVMCIVRGGADAEVARAIAGSKPAGIGTSGSIRAGAGGVTVRFERASEIRLLLSLTLLLRSNFPPNGLRAIRDALIAYINGELGTVRSGFYETGGLGIGEPVSVARLYTAVNSVPGHFPTIIARQRVGSDVTELEAEPALNQIYTLDYDDIGIAAD